MVKKITKKQDAINRLAIQGGKPQQMRQASIYGSATVDDDGRYPGCMDFGAVVLNPDYVIVRRDELEVLQEHYAPVPISNLVDTARDTLSWMEWLDGPGMKDHKVKIKSLREALKPYPVKDGDDAGRMAMLEPTKE